MLTAVRHKNILCFSLTLALLLLHADWFTSCDFSQVSSQATLVCNSVSVSNVLLIPGESWWIVGERSRRAGNGARCLHASSVTLIKHLKCQLGISPHAWRFFWTFTSKTASYNGRTISVTQTGFSAWVAREETFTVSTKKKEAAYISERTPVRFTEPPSSRFSLGRRKCFWLN